MSLCNNCQVQGEQAKVDYSVLSSAEHGARFSGWMKAYGALPASEKAMWEMKRRSHLAMQPYIRDVISFNFSVMGLTFLGVLVFFVS